MSTGGPNAECERQKIVSNPLTDASRYVVRVSSREVNVGACLLDAFQDSTERYCQR